jgi:hypothetical protein
MGPEAAEGDTGLGMTFSLISSIFILRDAFVLPRVTLLLLALRRSMSISVVSA